MPTFRSDVRIFLVKSKDGCQSSAWFGGGSDLTPYYLNDEDITGFHAQLKETVEKSFPPGNEYNLSHAQMKEVSAARSTNGSPFFLSRFSPSLLFLGFRAAMNTFIFQQGLNTEA